MKRNWRFGAVEQDPNAAVNAATTDNSAFPFCKARTTRGTEGAHPKAGPYSNRRSRQAYGTLVSSLFPHSLGPRNRPLIDDQKRTRKDTIAKGKSRTSGMNDKVAGMDVRRQNIVQRNRLATAQRNQGVRRARGTRLHVACEPSIKCGRGHDRRQCRQIDIVINRREVRNCVRPGRVVEDKLISATAARERIVVTGA